MKADKKKEKQRVMGRLLTYLFSHYKWQIFLIILFVLVPSAANVASSMFLQTVIDSYITPALKSGALDWRALLRALGAMGGFYAVAILCVLGHTQLMAVVAHKFLKQIRVDMFNKMQSLPVKYFDRNTHGDIMSTYTNDVDAIMQLAMGCIPQILCSVIMLVFFLAVMLRYSVWLTLIVLGGSALMIVATRFVSSVSSRNFIRQQKAIAKTEGYVEEMMNGQKVVKVFCHESAAEKGFDAINDELFDCADKANGFANILGPIVGNIGNLLYVVLAFAGGAMMLGGVKNVGLTGMGTLTVGVVVSFLTMSRGFSNNVMQLAQTVNAVVLSRAGASRVFALLDEKPETDEGYVTLVYAKEDENGNLTESSERTERWAWRHPHNALGTVTYTELKGHILLDDVDFAYEEGKTVLHNVTVEAKPGQRIAFVGSTGAGKTTITNLINRFYDIADGKIRYDGININKIKKNDLRRSLGMVLQDTNLFTGTVRENIRYGRLDATDEEVEAAAKLAGAHDFVTRLPEGYDTLLTSDGANLSQGQRQLLSIARAAVANTPVMIMDEATSSIDTRTEAIVQAGCDRLMRGRTVFIIAHRLSTVRTADVIMVLEHGRIIESGNHAQLLEKKGKYYQLYTGAFELD
ncbi:MAG: ABC transporter ATP-binding protein [Clostridia bacterium]|nr:ABC transporter ATP-binding protein [Clostridia bacterium]